jgi:hypothetical protein
MLMADILSNALAKLFRRHCRASHTHDGELLGQKMSLCQIVKSWQ